MDFTEMNYAFLTPYVLDDLEYSTTEVAAIMSTIGIADIIFRLLSPFIGDYFKQKPLHMFMYSGVIFIFTRLGKLNHHVYIEFLYSMNKK